MAYMCDYIIEMNQKNIRHYGAFGAVRMLFDDIFKTKKAAFIEPEIEEYLSGVAGNFGRIGELKDTFCEVSKHVQESDRKIGWCLIWFGLTIRIVETTRTEYYNKSLRLYLCRSTRPQMSGKFKKRRLKMYEQRRLRKPITHRIRH